MFKFSEFVNRKEREAQRHLHTIKKILEQGGLRVVDETNRTDDPFIFVYATENNLSFEGVRIYQIGSTIAYRIQKRPETQPYGRAYLLPIEEMFEDRLGGKENDMEIGEEIMKSMISEIKDFFKKSARAEFEKPQPKDPLDAAYMRSTGTDYANMVTDTQRR